MSISSLQSGYPIVQQSYKMADEAAREIQESNSFKNDFSDNDALKFNAIEHKKAHHPSKNDIEPMLKLNQAAQYNRVGTNVIQREQDMIGSLLDIHI
ncbi:MULTISPECIES: hypothetical protein [Vibrio]|uniref:Uncharacterized protein n=1 Tax=Vibrio diazotrophicus TaxID=685 RepID=A0A2J8G7D3_VIBDI|nr:MULTISPECIES: hypothetical protein [Vibrio]MCF7361438.1 hypothetical protein [Vibrio sp. A1-b2]MCZ4373155.1 hypothetical protein [Vibrio diazotrophicus]PNH81945.1 hypothetical protein C1N27_04390 [Vibrio diazotrophicus]PNH99659.1 hypothetical protein C1O25_15710 [Vibrio diazotrophicus]PNI03259.1 hypothetical protein C1N32_16785 [Vibrio diazotrophicus]